jgi:hypothetical protein
MLEMELVSLEKDVGFLQNSLEEESHFITKNSFLDLGVNRII